MPRKTAPETDNSEPVGGYISDETAAEVNISGFVPRYPTVEGFHDAFVRLKLSDIITVADGAITWRAGHLEHIANLFAGDPVTTERNYADDLAVARAYSAETWASLLEATK